MEILLGILALGGIGYAAVQFLHKAATAARARRTAEEARQRAAYDASLRNRQAAAGRHAQYDRLNTLAKQVQLALLLLDQAPDFRRAASWAHQAQEVPAPFRQRILQRFRPKLVQFVARRAAAGGDVDELLSSLTDLVQALGVAGFEADYIVEEARRRQTPRGGNRSYNQELRSLQETHEQRMAAIRALEGVEPDTQEQLLEAEQTRFREAILGLGQADEKDGARR